MKLVKTLLVLAACAAVSATVLAQAAKPKSTAPMAPPAKTAITKTAPAKATPAMTKAAPKSSKHNQKLPAKHTKKTMAHRTRSTGGVGHNAATASHTNAKMTAKAGSPKTTTTTKVSPSGKHSTSNGKKATKVNKE